MCVDPCLWYTEFYLRLELEISRVDFLLSVLVILWCTTFGVALARSCIVPVSLYNRCSVSCHSHCGDGYSM